MFINVTPLKRKFLVLISGKKNYQEISTKQWVLCPQETYCTPPAIYLETDLDKITAVARGTSFEIEHQRIGGGDREHKATKAYLLNDVEIINGYVYKGAMKYTLSLQRETHFGSPIVHNKKEAALSCTFCGNLYFAHWMQDDMPLTLAAQEISQPITIEGTDYSHEPGYLELFNIYRQKVDRIKCEKLTILDDVGQNKYKRKRYQLLKNKLKGSNPVSSHKGVMLLRGTSGVKRLLVNELEVAEFLKNQGFKIIDPSTMTPHEIVNACLGAKVVVGVEGSQLIHGFYTAAQDGTFLVLQPPYRFNNYYKDLTDCVGMNYAFLVGDKVDDGFEIDLNNLARILEKIQYG